MHISYQKTGGSFWKSSTLHYRAANAFAPDLPLFTASSDGERNASVEAFHNADPISTLLAAYAISCRLNPSEFSSGATVCLALRHPSAACTCTAALYCALYYCF